MHLDLLLPLLHDLANAHGVHYVAAEHGLRVGQLAVGLRYALRLRTVGCRSIRFLYLVGLDRFADASQSPIIVELLFVGLRLRSVQHLVDRAANRERPLRWLRLRLYLGVSALKVPLTEAIAILERLARRGTCAFHNRGVQAL